MIYDVVLTNYNTLNRISNVHPIIIVLEETNTKDSLMS